MNEPKQIPLTQGKVALVSPEDYEMVSRFKWHLTSGGYAARNRAGTLKRDYMHRVINQTPHGIKTDHRDRNRLNNTRENLRTATQPQNGMNKGKASGKTSQFKGVSFRPSRSKEKRNGCWDACIKSGGRKIGLGHYFSEMDAALAYNLKAKELFGEFASLNTLPLDFLRDNPIPKRFSDRKHSSHRGVTWNKAMKQWMAYFNCNGKRVHQSFHMTEELAAAAYQAAKTNQLEVASA